MSLRGKLLLAQAPLALALALVGVLSASVTTRLASQSRLILADNYRSVLAAQRMKESLERIDSNAVYRVVGHDNGTEAAIAAYRPNASAVSRTSHPPRSITASGMSR